MRDLSGKNPVGVRLTPIGVLAVLVLLGLLAWGALSLTGWISVPQGHFVVLIQKTGKDLSNDAILASSPEFKGVQLEVLKEGYHFYSRYSYTWTDPIPATVIPEMQVGILTRKYGKPLPPGQVLAQSEDEKGILADTLSPGRHYLNTYAYGIELMPMVRIEPGFMGIVTQLVGKDPVNPNVFVVNEGERGTQPYLLPPGIHPKYSNKWMYKVVPIDVRSHKIEMAGENAVDFPSQDGFPIHTEGTIEYAIDLKRLPELFVTFVDEKDLEASGGLNNIEQKLILPYGRSLYRIYGAQHKAVDYLIGSTRVAVQSQIEQELRETCAGQGIIIRSFVIRSTDPPQQIREQYERRELARRQKDEFRAEITTEIGYPAVEGGKPKLDANGQPMFDHGVPIVEGGKPKMGPDGQPVFEGGRLTKELQTRMKDRAQQEGEVAVEVATVTREAEQYGLVETTKANQRLEVAKLQLQAANDMAASKRSAGEAAAAVIRMKNQAQAAGVEANISAFGSGDKYAQYLLTTKFAPAIRNIWSNTDGLFANLFQNLVTQKDMPKTPATQPDTRLP
ncbi:MAG TPA: SPFH domain-containing protein [Phycisphaerae bacterium]|nr:SPFH domain-containing protein [Phycisphaerae bacterium]